MLGEHTDERGGGFPQKHVKNGVQTVPLQSQQQAVQVPPTVVITEHVESVEAPASVQREGEKADHE